MLIAAMVVGIADAVSARPAPSASPCHEVVFDVAVFTDCIAIPGQQTINGPSRFIRNGVGIDRSGRAHFVISDNPVSFGKLASLFRDQLNCPDALYFDGNVLSLWAPAMGRLDQSAALGPLILVENSRKARQP